MTFKDHLKTIGKGLAGLAEEGYEAAKKGAKEAREEVQRRGGVGKTFEQVVDGVARKAEEIASVASDKIDQWANGAERWVDNAENLLYTDGKYDPQKAKVLLNDAAETTRVYGVKAGKTLLDLAKSGVDLAKSGIDKYVPSEEDNKRYAGIGTAYQGILLRPHYEACLKFHEQARKDLPSGLKLRPSILADIKAHAVANTDELLGLYESMPSSESKIDAVRANLVY